MWVGISETDLDISIGSRSLDGLSLRASSHTEENGPADFPLPLRLPSVTAGDELANKAERNARACGDIRFTTCEYKCNIFRPPRPALSHAGNSIYALRHI